MTRRKGKGREGKGRLGDEQSRAEFRLAGGGREGGREGCERGVGGVGIYVSSGKGKHVSK